MKINNNKIKFNVIDIIISAFFALAIISSIYLFTQNQGIFINTHYNVEYTLEIQSVDQEIAFNISSGDTIYDSKSATKIGQVSNVYHRLNPDKTYHVMINISANAENHNGYTTINGVLIDKGYLLNFRTPQFSSIGKCVELSIK